MTRPGRVLAVEVLVAVFSGLVGVMIDASWSEPDTPALQEVVILHRELPGCGRMETGGPRPVVREAAPAGRPETGPATPSPVS